MKIFFILFMVCLMFPATSMAKKFRYTDSNGMLTYVEDYYAIPEEYRDQIKNFNPPPPKKEIFKTNMEIEVFMTSWCPYCKKLISFLEAKGIPYKKYDIEKDRQGNEKYRSLGRQGVPLTKIGNNLISGYNPEAIMTLLKEEPRN